MNLRAVVAFVAQEEVKLTELAVLHADASSVMDYRVQTDIEYDMKSCLAMVKVSLETKISKEDLDSGEYEEKWAVALKATITWLDGTPALLVDQSW